MTQFNPCEKSLYFYFTGVPYEIAADLNRINFVLIGAIEKSKAHSLGQVLNEPDLTGAHILRESHATFHSIPDAGYMSFGMSTCGETNPIHALRYAIEQIKPASAKVCYYKEGLDIAKRKTKTFPRTIDDVVRQNKEQFAVDGYTYDGQELVQHNYTFNFKKIGAVETPKENAPQISEKDLWTYFYGTPAEVITNTDLLDEIMQGAIKRSGAGKLGSLVHRFAPTGSSGVYICKSHAAFHTTPESKPNFMSYGLSTYGETDPLQSLGYTLEQINPSAGKICWYLDGPNITMPKPFIDIIEQHKKQFLADTYTLELQPVTPYEWNVYFYDPKRLTEKMASILGFDWPLTEEAKKPGIKEIRQSIMASQNGHSQPSAVPAKG